jgi:hypothetical protein
MADRWPEHSRGIQRHLYATRYWCQRLRDYLGYDWDRQPLEAWGRPEVAAALQRGDDLPLGRYECFSCDAELWSALGTYTNAMKALRTSLAQYCTEIEPAAYDAWTEVQNTIAQEGEVNPELQDVFGLTEDDRMTSAWRARERLRERLRSTNRQYGLPREASIEDLHRNEHYRGHLFILKQHLRRRVTDAEAAYDELYKIAMRRDERFGDLPSTTAVAPPRV